MIEVQFFVSLHVCKMIPDRQHIPKSSSRTSRAFSLPREKGGGSKGRRKKNFYLGKLWDLGEEICLLNT
jgi:hypothetical protein